MITSTLICFHNLQLYCIQLYIELNIAVHILLYFFYCLIYFITSSLQSQTQKMLLCTSHPGIFITQASLENEIIYISTILRLYPSR